MSRLLNFQVSRGKVRLSTNLREREKEETLRFPVRNHRPVKPTSNNRLDMSPKSAIESIEK